METTTAGAERRAAGETRGAYDKAVEMLLNKWEGMNVRVRPNGAKEIEPSLAEWLNAGHDAIRKQLNRLAFEAHRDQPQLTGTAGREVQAEWPEPKSLSHQQQMLVRQFALTARG